MTSAAAPAPLISRMLWRVLPAVIAAQLIIGWFAWTAMHDLVSNELQDRLHRQAEQYAQLIAFKLETVIGTATSVAENDLIVNGIMDAEGRKHYISVFFETAQVPGLADAEMTLADYKGRPIASNRPDADYRDVPWLQSVLDGEVWHEVANRAFIVAAPVMIAGQGEGLIVIQYDESELARLLTVPARTDAITVFTNAADPLYSSNPDFSAPLPGDEQVRSPWAVMSAGIPGFDEIILLAGERRAKALQTVDRLGLFLGATMLMSLVAVVAAVAATALMGTRPILNFIDDVERITRTGDLGQSVRSGGIREFHRLAGAFNRMLESLKSTTASRDSLRSLNAGLAEANLALDRANAELERSEARFELAVEGSSVGIWDWDANTGQLFWSDRMKRLVGVADENFTPHYRSFEERLHPEDRGRVLEYRRRHIAREGDYDVECRFRKEDGSYMWLHIRGQAVWDEAGNVTRLAGSAEDISERKAAEVERDRHAAELERSNSELDDFAHIASHDLKEPLRGISNHATFLKEDHGERLDEDGRNRLDRLVKLSGRMEKLIADLLFYSRIRKSDVESEQVDLNDIIADIEVSLADMMRQRNVRLVLPEPLPLVIAPRSNMMTIFQNLITNAIKYNDSDEKIVEVGLDPDAGGEAGAVGPVFYVRDNGIGIDDAFKDDVFRIFKRLNAEKLYGEGTGAGLTFVKKIVESKGGEIWFTSAPGEGTTFYFTLGGSRS